MNSPYNKYLDQVAAAVQKKNISQSAAENIGRWLRGEHFSDYWPLIADHIRNKRWKTLEDVFWTQIPFGTAGRRGRMYPIGCNAINKRTIGETIQALAEYVRDQYDGPRPATCAIAYDTRNNSESFARLSAEIMLAHDFDVLFFEGFRSTPLLATTVKYKSCACGIMISASHNPPSDNAAKVFWSTGGQLYAPHDAQITERMNEVTEIIRTPFRKGVREGRIRYVAEEMDQVYREFVLNEGFGLARGPRSLKILYSPLHGVGLTSVIPALKADHFSQVDVYERHAEPSGCFPNVPGHAANPENPAVFDELIEHAKATDADIVIASDPDADRLGCAAPLKFNGQEWKPINGNQIAVLLTEYVLRHRSKESLSADHFVIKTLVTTDMISRIAESYGIRAIGECLTGFKWIGKLIDENGADKFILGAEEAHGYLIGTHCRDKDGAVAAMLLAEFASEAKAAGRSLHQELHSLYEKHGMHIEKTIAKTMPGAEGMSEMNSIMAGFRERPPTELGGLCVTRIRDYLHGHVLDVESNERTELKNAPTGNVLVVETELAGNYIALRPSGTEPKIKFYMFTFQPPGDVNLGRQACEERLSRFEADLL